MLKSQQNVNKHQVWPNIVIKMHCVIYYRNEIKTNQP